MEKLKKTAILILCLVTLTSCTTIFISSDEQEWERQNIFPECRTLLGGRDRDCMRESITRLINEAKIESEKSERHSP